MSSDSAHAHEPRDPAASSPDTGELEDSLIRRIAAAPPIELELQRLAPGEIVGGSFRIEGVLGSGAMGVVYRAADLTLDRSVALKIHAGDRDEQRTSRMWREAKAMARLAHPNVIAVYEVGEHEGGVFIAMELVEGGTLRDRLRALPAGTRRRWAEVLRMFIPAAQGLAAAHEVGLVHRDFKPDNVLIGRDGRVRVGDFGLARAVSEIREPASRDWSPSGDSVSMDERLTMTGAAVGTPAYMAPEQILGGPVDRRVDQFAFCVALYEGLYRRHPFGTRSFGELAGRATRGRVRPPPPTSDVPSWLHAVLLRGLSPAPEARFSSMDELLAALRADPSRRRARVALGLGGAVTLGLAVWVTSVASSAPEPCRDMGAPVEALWNPAAAQRVERALRDTGSVLAEDAIERVRVGLDGYASAWTAGRTDACEATRVTGAQSESMLDRRMVCLDQRRQQLGAVLEVLSSADAEVVRNAVRTLDALGSISACADREALSARVPPPEDESMRREVSEAHGTIAAIDAAVQAGHSRVMRAEADALVERATQLGHAPLRAEAHLARYRVLHSLAENDPAIDDAVAGHRWATEVGDARLAWSAALAVARGVGQSPASMADGLRWLEAAEGWSRRFELDDDDRAMASESRVEVLQAGDRIEDALEVLRESLRQLESGGSASAGTIAGHHVGLAHLLRRLSRLDEAREHAERGVDGMAAAFGSSHPEVAWALEVLAHVERDLGRGPEALVALERSLELRREDAGGDSTPYATALRERGDILTDLGRFGPAIADYERALSIFVELPHRDPAEEIMTISNLANAHHRRGEEAEALKNTQRALERALEAYGAQSIRVAEIRLNYGSALSRAGRHADGIEQSRLALESLRRHFGPSHTSVGIVHLNLATATMEVDDLEEAALHVSHAREIFERTLAPDHVWRARVANVEASLLEAQGERSEALARRGEAVARFEEAVAPNSSDLLQARFRWGRLLVETGDAAAAVEPLSRAVSVGEAIAYAEGDLGTIRFWLARALWIAEPGRRAEARGIAERARTECAGVEPEMVNEIDRWLRARD